MPRKSSRQKLILANDKIFRQIIHLRDKVCQKTGKTENLQVAHFWTRSILRTRWDLDNACLLNAGTHLFWSHKYPQDFQAFWLKRLGKKKYEALELKARYVAPVKEFDLLVIHQDLKKLLSKMEAKNGNV